MQTVMPEISMFHFAEVLSPSFAQMWFSMWLWRVEDGEAGLVSMV